MTERAYPMVVRQLAEEDGGGFAAYAPDLFGCMGDGDTPQAAVLDLQEAIVEWVAEARRLDREVPEPNHLAARLTDERREQDELINAQQSLIEALKAEVERTRSELDELRAGGSQLAAFYGSWSAISVTSEKRRRSRVTN